MKNPHGVNLQPAIEQIKALSEQGWELSVNLSATKGEAAGLFGMTARRNLVGGYVECQVRPTSKRETIESIATDLVDLCSGFKIRQIGQS